MAIPEPHLPPPRPHPGGGTVLPSLLLLGAMFNLTLVVAGLKEFILGELGGTVADATLFFSVETFAYILCAPLWGLLSDRAGRRRPFIVAGFAASALLYASYTFVGSVPVLLALRFVQGAASVMGWSLVMASVVDQAEPQRAGRRMGLMGAALIFGVGLGAPVGGYLTRWAGPRAPVAAAAALFAVLALASLALREGGELRRGVTLREILGTLGERPRLLLPYAFHFVDRLAVGLFVVVFPLYLDSLGAGDPAMRGRYLAYFLLPFALLQYFTGRMSERTGPTAPLLVGSILYGAALATVGVADLLTLRPIMVVLGLFAAVMFPPAILLTARLADPRSRGSAMGGFNLAGSLGFTLGPLLGAWAHAARGFAFAFLAAGLLEIGVAVVAAFFLRPGRRAGG
ncbi:MAG: MFS transporter [Thermoanaerobaculia bacterium]